MRAISVKCPNCAARLNVAGDAPTTQCSYCGTTSRIQPRKPPGGAAQAPPPPAQMHFPVAHQTRSSRSWVAGIIVVSLVLTAGSVVIPLIAGGGIGGGWIQTIWSSAHPIPFDANGDGVRDALGRIHHVASDEQVIALAAHDGTSGDKLWESEELGGPKEVARGAVWLAGETLLYIDQRGQVHAFSAKSGDKSWQASLGERAETLCAGDGEAVTIQTKDEAWHELALADGSVTGAESPGACQRLSSDGYNALYGVSGLYDWTDDDEVPIPEAFDGMDVEEVAEIPDGPWIALGHKDPGTRVPMLAAYEATGDPTAETAEIELLWKAEVPNVDPLTVEEGEPEHFAVAGDRLVVAYELQDDAPPRATCFSLESGERLWDLGLPKPFSTGISGVSAAGDRAFIRVSGRLDAIDLAAGKRLYSLGKQD